MIKLTNSLTSKLEIFKPIDPSNVRMYVCGPTTYDDIHLGNARTVVNFDLLFRLLCDVYGTKSVNYISNFTDIDEKIINKVNEITTKPTINDISKFTDQVITSIKSDWNKLNVTHSSNVRVTKSLQSIFALITDLIHKHHAYISDNGDILFDISSNPHYGQLTGQKLGDEKDFALWKRRSHDQIGFDSPFGYGIPGWAIECSAMIKSHLGNVIDIHGGGGDLRFPHHENEIAQSTCANHTDKLANYFVHTGMVTVNGVKMSKSLGNHIVMKDLFKQYDSKIIRFDILRTKYNKILDFTYERLEESVKIYEKLISIKVDTISIDDEFLNILKNDINTPVAIMHLQKLFKQKEYNKVIAGLDFLGVL